MNGTLEVLHIHPQPMIPASYGANYSPVVVQMAPKKKSWAIPCIGILVVFFSLFLPYISILGLELTGFQTIELFIEGIDKGMIGEDSNTGDGELPLLMIAFFMLVIGPIFYSLMALISTFSMLFQSHPMFIGVLHLMYFGAFMLFSVLSTVDLGFLGSYSVHGDVTGVGFFVGGLAGILFCIKA